MHLTRGLALPGADWLHGPHWVSSIGVLTVQKSDPWLQEAVRAHLVRLLCDAALPHAQRLVSLHDLNRHLAAAPTFDTCVHIVEKELPLEVLKVALDLIATGREGCTHSRVSLDWLHGPYRVSSIECVDQRLTRGLVLPGVTLLVTWTILGGINRMCFDAQQ
jgi:hypothetical protein